MESEVVFLGGCILDLISYASRFPLPGETLIGTKFNKGFGGKSCNQCVMGVLLGTKTAMIAKVGEDDFGNDFISHMKKLGINTDYVTQTKDAGTSTATITVTESGENNIVNVFGAISHLSKKDVKEAAAKLFSTAKLLVCSMECPRDSLLEALTLAKKANLQTLLNAAPCTGKLDKDIYAQTDILCVNEVEASILTGLEVTSSQEAEQAAIALQKMGSPTVILTLGDKGALILENGQQSNTHVPCRKVKAVDTTGAGDAFVGSLAHYLVTRPELSLKEMVLRSCDIASISVLGEGTQISFPKRDQLPKELLG